MIIKICSFALTVATCGFVGGLVGCALLVHSDMAKYSIYTNTGYTIKWHNTLYIPSPPKIPTEMLPRSHHDLSAEL